MARLLLIFLAGVALYGCNYDEKREALIAYIENVKKMKPGEIEPLPQIQPYENFVYSADSLRSPFLPPVPEKSISQMVADNGIRPDTNRRKELLETFPIDALKMVGTVEKEGKIWALIVDKDGVLHRVSRGNYVGLNYGMIESISEEKMTITEVIPNPTGGWQERQAEITLNVEEQ